MPNYPNVEQLSVRRPQIYPECRTCEALNGIIIKARNCVSATPSLLEDGTFPEIVVDCIPKNIHDQHSVVRWLELSLQITRGRGQEEHELPVIRNYTNCPGMTREKQKRASGNKK